MALTRLVNPNLNGESLRSISDNTVFTLCYYRDGARNTATMVCLGKKPFMYTYYDHCTQIEKTLETFWFQGFYCGAPRRVRIPNLLIRSQMLYPVERWA